MDVPDPEPDDMEDDVTSVTGHVRPTWVEQFDERYDAVTVKIG